MKPSSIRWFKRFVSGMVLAVSLLTVVQTKAEDGYRLWLRYDPFRAGWSLFTAHWLSRSWLSGNSASLDAARSELVNGCSGCWAFPFPSSTKSNVMVQSSWVPLKILPFISGLN